ncbi:extracellular solute-binding protein family 3 [Methanococcus vannielii SB]|uniref:Extracellular solute-binding protein family 3 n=1 Tax=Methanococcus vannielii (strain ATCC 35089 / DSM 1224 / JCM 13029 / OCM 148 / SB) TaxID=406327 RepID=A6UP27_METVS|nr:ABC transporter substrate-binding protein [Methanococcus vannielii]ABR54249.1 extracellular solute-binding protein family 3 [Methanococcus vannielii SB]
MQHKSALLLILLLIASSGCILKNNELTLKEGTLTVGVYPYMAPMTYMKDDELTGYEIEMISEMAKRMDYNVNFKVYEFERLFSALEYNEIDCAIAGIGITIDRKTKFEFSRPYRYTFTVITVLKDSSISKINDIEGQKVGVLKGTLMENKANELRRTRSFEIIKYSSPEIMYSDLNSKKISAAITDLDSINYNSQNQNIRVLDEHLDIIYMGIALKKGNVELLNNINTVMLEMEKDGYFEYLRDTWIE